MTNAIMIGETIKQQILENEELAHELGIKICAVIAPNEMTFPLIVYTRETVTNGANTKDGFYGDYVTFRVDVLDKSYSNCCRLANKIRRVFEKRYISGIGIELHNTQMTAVGEAWDSDCYINQVRFTTFVTDKAPEEENNQNE